MLRAVQICEVKGATKLCSSGNCLERNDQNKSLVVNYWRLIGACCKKLKCCEVSLFGNAFIGGSVAQSLLRKTLIPFCWQLLDFVVVGVPFLFLHPLIMLIMETQVSWLLWVCWNDYINNGKFFSNLASLKVYPGCSHDYCWFDIS